MVTRLPLSRELDDEPTAELPILSVAVPDDFARTCTLPVLTESLQDAPVRPARRQPAADAGRPGAHRESAPETVIVTSDRVVRDRTVERLTSSAVQPPLAESEQLEALAALCDYVDGRSRWWQEMEARAEEDRLRILELKRELAQRTTRQIAAEALAEREARRAAALHVDLAESRREIERLAKAVSRATHPTQP